MNVHPPMGCIGGPKNRSSHLTTTPNRFDSNDKTPKQHFIAFARQNCARYCRQNVANNNKTRNLFDSHRPNIAYLHRYNLYTRVYCVCLCASTQQACCTAWAVPCLPACLAATQASDDFTPALTTHLQTPSSCNKQCMHSIFTSD